MLERNLSFADSLFGIFTCPVAKFPIFPCFLATVFYLAFAESAKPIFVCLQRKIIKRIYSLFHLKFNVFCALWTLNVRRYWMMERLSGNFIRAIPCNTQRDVRCWQCQWSVRKLSFSKFIQLMFCCRILLWLSQKLHVWFHCPLEFLISTCGKFSHLYFFSFTLDLWIEFV